MKIKVQNLGKSFKGIEVLRDVNVELESGNIYGLIGRNGSGKSVFLKILCGFYKPTAGTVLYDDIDIHKTNTFPPSTRALIEKPCFFPDLTGYENLQLLASIQSKIGKEEILKTIQAVNLEKDQNKRFKQYSLGMKQKLGIAQVLMENPEVIILDEPFNGIEHKTAADLRKILLEEKKKGKLIIIATHIKEDIEALADIVYEFDDGTIIEKNDAVLTNE